MSPEQQKQQTLHALLTILLRLAAQQPVLFVMEDLHWVDPSTLEFLSVLVDQGPTARILALFTFRPDFSPPWTGRSHLTQVTLPRLPRQQVTEMAGRVAHGKALPAEVVEQVVAKTDGVPLFVEELTKMVLESGLLREHAERYELTRPLPPLAIPTTLHDSLMARLDRLATVKSLAQLGATLGREFSYELLHAVAPWDEATVKWGLHQLVAAEFLYQQGLPPQATYRFKHALLQDAAYQSLLRSTRQQYHQRIAQVLAGRFPDLCESQPEVLAHHATEAGLHAQALGYWQQAGQRAIEHSAHREEITCFEHALEALQRLPESRERIELAIELHVKVRNALIHLGEYAQLLEHLRAAERLAESLEDQTWLGKVSSFMTNAYRNAGAPDQALVYGQRTRTIAQTLGDFSLQVVANLHVGGLYEALGDYRRGREVLSRNVALLIGDHTSAFFGLAAPPAVLSRSNLVVCHTELGEFDDGITCGNEAVRIAEAAHRPLDCLYAYRGLGYVYLRQGALAQAIPVLERGLALCRDRNIANFFPQFASQLGLAYMLSKRLVEALPCLEQARDPVVLSKARQTSSYVLWAGEAYALAGYSDDARALAERALTLAQIYKERGAQAWTLRLLGEIHTHRDHQAIEQAEAYYQQALDLAEELGMRPLQAHCHRGLGTLYAAAGQREQARTALSTAIEMYTSMEMTFWLPQTEAALAQVEGR
jgi:tetratricopeptide (TPR) repeat protein